MNTPEFGLEKIFAAVGRRMAQEQDAFNLADTHNHNHGSHLVEIFASAAGAAAASPADLPAAMESAGRALSALQENGSAQVYARGLAQFAKEFSRNNVDLDDLINYVKSLLVEDSNQKIPGNSNVQSEKSNAVLKALLGGLMAWKQVEAGQEPSGKLAELGALFDLGIVYMQAKQRGGSRAQVLADAAATASPLSQVPYRYQSGILALRTLLEAIAGFQDHSIPGSFPD